MTIASDNVEPAQIKPGDSNVAGSAFEREQPKSRFQRLNSWLSHVFVFSSLTRRIVFLNLLALLVLVSGILYLNQFRDGLIDARVESLLTQGEIIAGAIAASATVETNGITIDPEKLLELQAGENTFPGEFDDVDFPINPEKIAPVLRRLISPTRTRARIYDRDGLIILDSKHLYSRGQVFRFNLPPLEPNTSWFESIENAINRWLQRDDLALYREFPDGNGTGYGEVVTALTGSPASVTRMTESAELIVSVAVPVQRFRAVLGVLLLSTEAGDIDKIVQAERNAILRVFMVAAMVTIVLSLLLASTIAQPLRRLSAAATRVRRGAKSSDEIPDFSNRRDEIGDLSSALRGMTASLHARIEAIESFAADVSHELKNPLTSLRSAVETLPLVKNEKQRKLLLGVIEHDVMRLDRLITNISDASRIDAELAREDREPIDLEALLRGFKSANDEVNRNRKGAVLSLIVEPFENNNMGRRNGRRRTIVPETGKLFMTLGWELRLGQVINNIVDNARSFVPEKAGKIDIILRRRDQIIELIFEDNGPGFELDNSAKIFERFYTDRPESHQFGQNSGLGLSISKQIIEAHDGTITAENLSPTEETTGARFTVTLPVFQPV